MANILSLDEAAFRTFYESTRKTLWGYIVKVMGDQTMADDILQESYVRFLQADLGKLDGTQYKAYLYRIATNLIHDNWRRVKRDRRWTSGFEDQSITHSTGDLDTAHDVGFAFQQLTQQQRSLLWLAYVEEYPQREIADMLKLREGSVKVLLFRAKQKLIDILKRMGIESEKKQ